jgi:hypothetical protein
MAGALGFAHFPPLLDGESHAGTSPDLIQFARLWCRIFWTPTTSFYQSLNTIGVIATSS